MGRILVGDILQGARGLGLARVRSTEIYRTFFQSGAEGEHRPEVCAIFSRHADPHLYLVLCDFPCEVGNPTRTLDEPVMLFFVGTVDTILKRLEKHKDVEEVDRY